MTVWFEAKHDYTPPVIDESEIEGKEVTCDDFFNEVYPKVIDIIGRWRYTGNITTYEIDAAWEAEPVKTNFKSRQGREVPRPYGWFYDHDMVIAFRQLKMDISKMYQDRLDRYPSHDEINFTYEYCKWNFTADNKKDSLKSEMSNIYSNQRDVPIERCLVCGETVYASCPWTLNRAGEIVMHFGYGSRRDLEYGKGYIHDHCSAILDQKLLKIRFDWADALGGGNRIDIEAWEECEEWKREDLIKFDGDGLDQMLEECSFDWDNNESYYEKKNENKDKT